METPRLIFNVITLFPDLIDGYCQTSIVGRGAKAGLIKCLSHNPREFCQDKYRRVDDTPYGGGAGMVLKPEPIFACLEAIEREPDSPVIITSPQGKPFKQADAENFAQAKNLTIICGHYEGFDERIHSLASHEISIGDFVLTGGELAALVIIDAVARLVPGVLGQSLSLHQESFNEGNSGLLEGPQYTKPPIFRDMEVPEILRSGDHKKINRWRREQALRRTYERRPDLLESASLNETDKAFLRKLQEEL
jgi:tRNA (guanine37-N1)-methyltransferase